MILYLDKRLNYLIRVTLAITATIWITLTIITTIFFYFSYFYFSHIIIIHKFILTMFYRISLISKFYFLIVRIPKDKLVIVNPNQSGNSNASLSVPSTPITTNPNNPTNIINPDIQVGNVF